MSGSRPAVLREIAYEVYARLPESAQDIPRRALKRREELRARRELMPWLSRVDAAVGGFEGKEVVEIGSEADGLSLQLVTEHFGAAQAVGLNPEFPNRKFTPRAELVQVPAQSAELKDESIDIVISWSAFEHIHDIPAVLAKMYRVLRPGGLLFSHFGPLWSTSYGHHLELSHAGQLLSYHNVILSPWCHLLRTEDDVRDELARAYGEDLASQMAEFVFRSEGQNHLLFDDYVEAIDVSEFETLYFKGYDVPELAEKYPLARSPAVLDELESRYPGREGWLYDGITLSLRK